MRTGDASYWGLFFFSLLGIILVPFFLPYGGIAPDSVSYFKLAKNLPCVENNLFPIGYPVLLKIGYFFTQEFYFSSHIISILSYTLIGLFSYFKKFYFKETVILLTFKFFISIYVNSISESVFLTLLYLQFYYLHQYLSGDKKGIKFIFPATLLMIYMVMVRYSGIYVFIGIGLFFLYYTIKNKFFPVILSKSYFYYLVCFSLGIGIYLLYNYINFGGLFGEQIRTGPNIGNLKDFTIENVLGLINVVNPVFFIKILSGHGLSLVLEMIMICIDILLLIFFIWFYKKYFKNNLSPFHQLLLIVGTVYAGFMLYSEYKQGIEALNTRMLAAASLSLLFSFLILYYKTFPDKIKIIIILGWISLFYNVLYQLKTPVNYLSYKARVDKVLEEKKGIKYFYDDTENEKTISVYKIPFTNKKIEHIHPYTQSGYINANIISMIDPEIIFLKSDTIIKNKNQILYNSELK